MSTETWETPDNLWNTLNLKYKFDLDPASPRGYKRPVKFYTIDDDGLSKPWHGVVFCNPPWSQIPQWLAKGIVEMDRGRATKIVWLLPSRTGKAWWCEHFDRGFIDWIPGRLIFKGATNHCMEYTCLWIWEKPR